MPGLFVRRPAHPAYHVRLFGPETLSDGTEQWAASFEEIPGCLSQGASATQAEATLWRILPRYLQQLRSRDLPVPAQIRSSSLSVAGVTIVMPMSEVPGTDATRTVLLSADGNDRRTAASRADCALIGS